MDVKGDGRFFVGKIVFLIIFYYPFLHGEPLVKFCSDYQMKVLSAVDIQTSMNFKIQNWDGLLK